MCRSATINPTVFILKTVGLIVTAENSAASNWTAWYQTRNSFILLWFSANLRGNANHECCYWLSISLKLSTNNTLNARDSFGFLWISELSLKIYATKESTALRAMYMHVSCQAKDNLSLQKCQILCIWASREIPESERKSEKAMCLDGEAEQTGAGRESTVGVMPSLWHRSGRAFSRSKEKLEQSLECRNFFVRVFPRAPRLAVSVSRPLWVRPQQAHSKAKNEQHNLVTLVKIAELRRGEAFQIQ